MMDGSLAMTTEVRLSVDSLTLYWSASDSALYAAQRIDNMRDSFMTSITYHTLELTDFAISADELKLY
jgi:hypothetical protein